MPPPDDDRAPALTSRRTMAERQAREAIAFQQKLLEGLRQLDPKKLKPAEIIRWFDVSAKVERASRELLAEAEEADGRDRDRTDADRRAVAALLADPDARRLAALLAEHLHGPTGVAGAGGPAAPPADAGGSRGAGPAGV